MLEWWSRECALRGVLPSVSACPVPHRESRDVRIFLILHLCFKKKKRTDVRTQNSSCSPNLQTTAIPSFHPPSAENLMRGQSRVCPDHHFLPQPVTYLSSLIEFTRTQSASFPSLSFVFCSALSEPSKNCAATHLPVCLQTFYITVSALVKDESASRVTERKRGREREGGLQLLLLCLCLLLIHSFKTFPDSSGKGRSFDALLFLTLSITVTASTTSIQTIFFSSSRVEVSRF